VTKKTLRADSDDENRKVEAKARKSDKDVDRARAYYGTPFRKKGDVRQSKHTRISIFQRLTFSFVSFHFIFFIFFIFFSDFCLFEIGYLEATSVLSMPFLSSQQRQSS
jgi:hypothetical protein